jgi:hypothetical protein
MTKHPWPRVAAAIHQPTPAAPLVEHVEWNEEPAVLFRSHDVSNSEAIAVYRETHDATRDLDTDAIRTSRIWVHERLATRSEREWNGYETVIEETESSAPYAYAVTVSGTGVW